MPDITPNIARDPAPEPPLPFAEIELNDPELYENRELSWLDFNDRVFAEARDPRNPLLERVKFLAITASNLDEFYSKRLGWLKRQMENDPHVRTVDGLTIREQLQLVRDRCEATSNALNEVWARDLRPALAENGVRIVRYADLDEELREELRDYFVRAVFPVLTPLVVDPSHPFPFISGGSLSLALGVRDPHQTWHFARVKVPDNRPRFIDVGDGRFVPIEELIGAHLEMLFTGAEVSPWQVVRVLRSAVVGGPGEEAEDLRDLIESELRLRRFAEAVVIEVDSNLPANRLELLLEELELEEDDVVRLDHFVGLADLMEIASLPMGSLSFPPFTPEIPSAFLHVEDDRTFFATLRSRDVMVHHPYESFDASVARFVEEASRDPSVLAIKQTLYRTSPDSPLLRSLIDAAGRGKQVAVVVELSARFDEANNLEWARRLEDAGVHIAYGSPSMKVHSKISLVVREEPSGLKLYCHIGTGNYNSRTARVYTDFGLFTADPAICADLLAVFNDLTGFSREPATTTLLVAPFNLRTELEARVRREIEHARAGRPARLIFKMNALEDTRFTQLLYEASRAGVQVDLIVRGICRLRPGVPGLSDNVRVVSVIGRFLEHSRIYAFENDGSPEYFIGSADIMNRNLDERIEVLTPINAPALQEQLRDTLELLLADRRQAWQLIDRTWTRDETSDSIGVQATLLAAAPFS
ncbi:MAG: polyphosphate kinase 1 [Chloroflexi bacterium]|nr:polyphosphate kinase 1 [Chloroflexota bacterium]MDA1147951.1 polyphosphate kinase 1 [Chloroflexota bacterium]